VSGEFVFANAFHLPFPDQAFDVVISTGLLEHFLDLVPIVEEMSRVLRHYGGVFFRMLFSSSSL
jgi:ubiquinone/menaquinone biosynthesis C-methylase UbiE